MTFSRTGLDGSIAGGRLDLRQRRRHVRGGLEHRLLRLPRLPLGLRGQGQRVTIARQPVLLGRAQHDQHPRDHGHHPRDRRDQQRRAQHLPAVVRLRGGGGTGEPYGYWLTTADHPLAARRRISSPPPPAARISMDPARTNIRPSGPASPPAPVATPSFGVLDERAVGLVVRVVGGSR
ncbi:hypothetical protein ACFSTC_52010 [Nonomuraea ferruginea]